MGCLVCQAEKISHFGPNGDPKSFLFGEGLADSTLTRLLPLLPNRYGFFAGLPNISFQRLPIGQSVNHTSVWDIYSFQHPFGSEMIDDASEQVGTK